MYRQFFQCATLFLDISKWPSWPRDLQRGTWDSQISELLQFIIFKHLEIEMEIIFQSLLLQWNW